MPYKRYGAVFETLRKQKHLPLSYFESFGIEKTTIQRFETGKTYYKIKYSNPSK